MKDSVFRLSEIAATQAALADEAQRILADLAGAGVEAPSVTDIRHKTPDASTVPDIGNEAQDAPSPPIDLDNLASIPQVAADFGVSDKTLRKWARKHHAIVTIGGRVYADVSILTASVISRKVPQISLSIDATKRKAARRANRKQS